MTTWQARSKYPGIYQDAADPKHWRIVVNLGRAAAGQPRQRAVKVLRGTLTDARKARTSLEGRKDKGQVRAQAKGTPGTVGAWLDFWLETYKRRRITRSTLMKYEDVIALYLKPTLGTKRLRALTGNDVQEFYNALADRGLHPSTIHQAAALLKQALRQAARTGACRRDIMDDAEAPKRPGRRQFVLPAPEQVHELLETMRRAGASAYPLTRFAFATGLREGELIALEWASVDMKAGVVKVCRNASRVRSEDAVGKRYVAEFKVPKTDASAREVPIDADTLAWLKSYRRELAQIKMRMRPSFWQDVDGDLVFPQVSAFAGSPAGRAWQPSTIRKAFSRYAEKVGLGTLRVHDCRHIYASYLLRNGVPIQVVKQLLGHSKIATTIDTYGWVLDDQKKAGVETLRGMFGVSDAN